MINIFRKTKWQICYVEEVGAPKEQAKEQFRQYIGDKPIVKVRFSMLN